MAATPSRQPAGALETGGASYSSVSSILKNKRHRHRPGVPTDGLAISHQNISGPRYFH
ncbi:MAG: hypothetical protein AAFY66_07575 [Pseudomonadota bacterium]